MSLDIKIIAAGLPWMSANLLMACLSFSSAAFLHVAGTCIKLT